LGVEEKHRRTKERSNLTLGEIVDRTAQAGFGFLAAFLALVAIPFVGLSTPFGLAIGFLGAQMLVGSSRPWLPGRLRRHLVAMATLDWIDVRLVRWTSGLERLIRPRWAFLARGPFFSLVGLGIVLQGVGLAMPLPIPGSNWIFIVPILVYAIGLLEADGLLIMIGHAATTTQLALGVAFWDLMWRGVSRVLGWETVAG
jgi:hypothetical protein